MIMWYKLPFIKIIIFIIIYFAIYYNYHHLQISCFKEAQVIISFVIKYISNLQLILEQENTLQNSWDHKYI